MTVEWARMIVSGQSPAGTAKSALSFELEKIVQGTESFQWLVTRIRTAEVSQDLEQGVYKRKTTCISRGESRSWTGYGIYGPEH